MDGPTAQPIVRTVRDAIADTAGPSLIGLYVYGSIVTGDFEPHVSDVDLIAVLVDEPDADLLMQLASMHAEIVRDAPEWDDRIEVDYVSAPGLATCRTRTTTIARISPGEPLHLTDAGREYLLDWYPARQHGAALIGPPIDTLIPPISEIEYIEEVRTYLAGFRNRFGIDASAGSQAYAILTMCRGFYSLADGDQVSKREAARRARRDFPHWEPLIERALAWRDRQWDPEQPDGSAHLAQTRSFIDEMAERLDLG